MPHSPASFESEVHVPGEDGRAYTISPRAKVMGTGGFAEVRVAQCVATGCAVAAKIIQLRPVGKTDERTVLREVRIMQQACSLPHANILRVLDVHIAIDTDADITRNSPLGPAGTAYILLELCEGGELFDRLTEFGQIPETVAVGYMRGLLKAVQHLHARGVIHRDIKLENALVAEDGTVKLADFGLAAELAVDATGAPLNVNAMLRDIVGSQSYVAPEVLVRKLKGYAGPPVDAWSCGVCLFTMLSGFFPLDVADSRDWRYRRLQAEQAMGNTQSCKSIFHMYQRECPFSEQVQLLLDGLLRVDPKARTTVDDALRTAWLAAEPQDSTANVEEGAEGVVYRSFPFSESEQQAPALPLSPGMPVPTRQAAHMASVLSCGCSDSFSQQLRAHLTAVPAMPVAAAAILALAALAVARTRAWFI